jgi:peptidoglycan/LPS O-acetylase OafA/YrhL
MSTLLAPQPKTDKASQPVTTGLRNLDVLRALAVLLVLFAHSTPAMTFGSEAIRDTIEVRVGRFGVLLFFVHTALVLMMSLQRNSSTSRFYIQRIFRIYPLSIFLVAIVLYFHVPPMPPKTFEWPHPARIVENLLLIQNFVAPLKSYSAVRVIANNSLSSPLWSLPFEIQMYALLPAVFYFVRKHRTEGAVVLLAASIVMAIAEKSIFPTSSWLMEFFPCFMAGVLAFTLLDRTPRLSAYLWPIAICTVAVACFALGMSSLAQWGACILIGVSIPLFDEMAESYVTRVAFVIARYSYGIYLVHVPLRWLCFEHVQASPWFRWPCYILFVTTLPRFLYHLIETPTINYGRRIVGLTSL